MLIRFLSLYIKKIRIFLYQTTFFNHQNDPIQPRNLQTHLKSETKRETPSTCSPPLYRKGINTTLRSAQSKSHSNFQITTDVRVLQLKTHHRPKGRIPLAPSKTLSLPISVAASPFPSCRGAVGSSLGLFIFDIFGGKKFRVSANKTVSHAWVVNFTRTMNWFSRRPRRAPKPPNGKFLNLLYGLWIF